MLDVKNVKFIYHDMTQEDLLKRYESYDVKVQEYMKYIASSILEKHPEIPDIYVASLDILAGNFVIMNESINNIIQKKDGIVGTDNYRGEKKSTSLTAFLSTQSNVMKILSTFGWTPAGKAKIKSIEDEVDLGKYINNLSN